MSLHVMHVGPTSIRNIGSQRTPSVCLHVGLCYASRPALMRVTVVHILAFGRSCPTRCSLIRDKMHLESGTLADQFPLILALLVGVKE